MKSVMHSNRLNQSKSMNSCTKTRTVKLQGVIKLIVAMSLLPAVFHTYAGSAGFTAQQQDNVRAIVKDTLIHDPILLKQALIALQAREQLLAAEAQQHSLQTNHKAMYDSQSDPWMGSATPAMTLVYFTDFNCPYCKKIEPSLNQLIKEFPTIKIIVKMVPLQGDGSKMAVDLAQTVWLNEPAKYLKLKDLLMSSTRALDAETITKVAQLTETERWLKNTDQRVTPMVQDNIRLMNELSINGTPSIIFGDKVIRGLVPYQLLKEQLKDALQTQKKAKQGQ